MGVGHDLYRGLVMAGHWVLGRYTPLLGAGASICQLQGLCTPLK